MVCSLGFGGGGGGQIADSCLWFGLLTLVIAPLSNGTVVSQSLSQKVDLL